MYAMILNMQYSFKSVQATEYNPFTIDSDAHLTQSAQYGIWQETLGKKVLHFELRDEEQVLVITGQYIAYPLIKGYTYWYAPYGPVTSSDAAPEAVTQFLSGVKNEAQKHHAIFVRSELSEKYDYKETIPFVSKSSYTQERCEWVIDATQTIEDILKNMEQKTRYNVRLAEKKNLTVTVEKGTISDESKAIFLQLMEDTAKRNGFRLHEDGYYGTIFDNLNKEKNGATVIILKDEIPLAMNLLVKTGETVHYLFGGSSDEYKNLMGSYLVHLESIKVTQSWGAHWYSFGAVNKDDSIKNALSGITHFKKRFGGMDREHGFIVDEIIDTKIYLAYTLYKFLSVLKRRLFSKL
jgi:lipid II:glycine glycyltransferase (peptidoglycan interpeptide bridge formation enzyme)